MRLRWTTRADGLPPGQRLLRGPMPRFTDRPFDEPPPETDIHIVFSREGEQLATLDAHDFASLSTRPITADFHCVTTWSVTGLVWTGVPLHEVFAALNIAGSAEDFVVVRASDHRRGHFVWHDAMASDVLLATHLNGQPLGARHGGPVRLVAPQHYGYKSIKHVTGIDLRAKRPTRLGKEHLRGRVDQEERNPVLPTWLVRRPSRWLIAATAIAAERSLARFEQKQQP